MFITFDYQCPSCGHRETRFVRRSEMDSQKCRECSGTENMRRLPAAPVTTFRFADRNLKR